MLYSGLPARVCREQVPIDNRKYRVDLYLRNFSKQKKNNGNQAAEWKWLEKVLMDRKKPPRRAVRLEHSAATGENPQNRVRIYVPATRTP